MIRSMTGFGNASREVDGVHYAVEIRSLNNRYFKSILRLPDDISGLEAELDSLLRKRLTRGSITLNVAVRGEADALGQRIDHAALAGYLTGLKQFEDAHPGLLANRQTSLDLAHLLSLPGIVQTPTGPELLGRCRPVVTRLVEESCEKLIAMREREGQGLLEDLLNQKQVIAERLAIITERAPGVVEDYHQRLQQRVAELVARAELKFSENDFIREVAVFAERSDISEEIQRLAAHLDQFDEIMHRDNGDPAGRTLDFLSQELLREANTIASKCNDAQISRLIVEVKGAIDRIKEQVQNVE